MSEQQNEIEKAVKAYRLSRANWKELFGLQEEARKHYRKLEEATDNAEKQMRKEHDKLMTVIWGE